MEKVQLPEEFRARMKSLLGSEYEAFERSYDRARVNGLRLNTLKMSEKEFEKISPFALEKIPWAPAAYYYDYKDAPGRHPYYQAGLYYLQEPSAMMPALLLGVRPGERVLDLCAAPGGKSTQLGAALRGRGILISNEISASRAKALVKNIELFGIVNACVYNAVPAKLEPFFPSYFDKVLVDAPCSGEGMFRKDIQAVKSWSRDKSAQCASIQRDIILRAADMLRPGGKMVYSTCTFSPEENELVIAHLLRERPEMELLEAEDYAGQEGFARGFSREKLTQLGLLPEQDSMADEPGRDLGRTIRLWPHRVRGEGHFMALLRKRGGPEGPAQEMDDSRTGMQFSMETRYGASQVTSKSDICSKTHCREEVTEEKVSSARRGKDRKLSEKPRRGSGRVKDNLPDPGQLRWVRSFLEDYQFSTEPCGRKDDPAASDLAGEKSLKAASDLAGKKSLKAAEGIAGSLEVHKGQVYYVPAGIPDTKGISILRKGLYLGELKKDRFEPAQELAMALPVFLTEEASALRNAGEESGNRIIFPPDSEQLQAYLSGDETAFRQQGENGWRLVTVDGLPLGWARLVNGKLKNKYLQSWRISR